ncbi:MAG: 1-deoxy-D-xylulose-5-phosphate synthase [Candidatus Dasytiphilus stammeri]
MSSFNFTKYPILAIANSVQDLRSLSEKKLPNLCEELRNYLLESISQCGGHLASGLGVIELTVALHYVYNTPFDYLIWDVGHQAYPHKILTGRRDLITSIRQKDGLHSFPCRKESEYDVVTGGHSSTAISAGLGLSVAATKDGKGRKIVCVIGDGGITAGITFEAMNHAGDINTDLLIVLNDNKMSISKNVGALNKHLFHMYETTTISEKKHQLYKKILKIFKVKNNMLLSAADNTFFKTLGFNYTGPVDGHDVIKLVHMLTYIRNSSGPQFLHVITKKGKGYLPAESNPITWHAVSNFDLAKGILVKKNEQIPSFQKIFGQWLHEIAQYEEKLIAITPAMCEGSGMFNFSKNYPKQYFDVAIAEQHAVTFAAGLVIGGYKPVVVIYSTFLQRAYDQFIHDIAIPKLSVLFAIDRAGIVGSDGETHQGVFDISFLRCIPHIIIMTPSDENECRQMLYTGYYHNKGPCAVRYPRGKAIGVRLTPLSIIPIGKSVLKRKGKKIAILNFGILLSEAFIVAKNINATLIDMRFVKPLDEKIIIELASKNEILVTLEEGVIKGGAGSGVNELLMAHRCYIPVLNIGIPDEFIPQGTQEEIRQVYRLDAIGIQQQILEYWSKSENE